jgi:SET domain-containing protein
LSLRENWLGVRFQKELSEGAEPPVSVRWIDDLLGYGVFAEEDIPGGAFLGEYTGVIRKRRRRRDRKNDYCFEYTIGDWVYNPFIIDAKEQGNFTRFINHSQEPNVESLSVHANEIMHIIFVAQEPIKAGQELRYHYGDTFWKKRRDVPIVD